MVDRKRDIFIRLDNVQEILDLLVEIKKREESLNKLFLEYDKLNLKETKIFENWSHYYEDISQKLDHITS